MRDCTDVEGVGLVVVAAVESVDSARSFRRGSNVSEDVAREVGEADRRKDGAAWDVEEVTACFFDGSLISSSSACKRSTRFVVAACGAPVDCDSSTAAAAATCRFTAGTGGGRLRSCCCCAEVEVTVPFRDSLAPPGDCAAFSDVEVGMRAGKLGGGRDAIRSRDEPSADDAIEDGRGGSFGCGVEELEVVAAAAADESDALTDPARGRLPTSDCEDGLERDFEPTRLRLGSAGGIVPLRCGSRGGGKDDVSADATVNPTVGGAGGGMRRLPLLAAELRVLVRRTLTKPSSMSEPVVEPEPARGRSDGRESDRLTGDPREALPLDEPRSIRLLDATATSRPDCLVISSRISFRLSSLTT